MRSEQQMMALIMDTARNDERIRAVMMNGSRVNPSAKRDIFQDFDIVYFVTDVGSFTSDHSWVKRFGEMMIMQLPEAMGDPPPMKNGHFAYLMQFMDGNRIDLTLWPLAKLDSFHIESLSVMLLDKDQRFAPLPPPSDSDHRPSPPTARAFADCCNEFWWVAVYVAKGVWREEIIYAKHMLDGPVREQLMKMLDWHIGIRTRFTAGAGKYGKHLKQRLDPAHWALLERTYASPTCDQTWDALDAMCELFRTIATGVAAQTGYDYPTGDDHRVSAHLARVRALPRDATDFR